MTPTQALRMAKANKARREAKGRITVILPSERFYPGMIEYVTKRDATPAEMRKIKRAQKAGSDWRFAI